MQDRNHGPSPFTGSPLQPHSRTFRRPRPSPHIHVVETNLSCTPVSHSDMSSCSIPESPIEEAVRPAPLTPDLRQQCSFEDWRMPAFSSMMALPEILRDDDLRDIQSTRVTTTQALNRPQRPTRNMPSLGGGLPGDEFQTLAPASHTKGSHRRRKNQALDSAQFDSLLTEVFYQ